MLARSRRCVGYRGLARLAGLLCVAALLHFALKVPHDSGDPGEDKPHHPPLDWDGPDHTANVDGGGLAGAPRPGRHFGPTPHQQRGPGGASAARQPGPDLQPQAGPDSDATSSPGVESSADAFKFVKHAGSSCQSYLELPPVARSLSLAKAVCEAHAGCNAIECSHGQETGCTLRKDFNLVPYPSADCHRPPYAEAAAAAAATLANAKAHEGSPHNAGGNQISTGDYHGESGVGFRLHAGQSCAGYVETPPTARTLVESEAACIANGACNAVECAHGQQQGCTLRSAFFLIDYAPSDCYRTPHAEAAAVRADVMWMAEVDAQAQRAKAWREFESAAGRPPPPIMAKNTHAL